jgi:hypothetical protein
MCSLGAWTYHVWSMSPSSHDVMQRLTQETGIEHSVTEYFLFRPNLQYSLTNNLNVPIF